MDQESELTENSTKWTKTQKLTLSTFYVATVIVFIYYSLMGPFFPEQAAEKGMSAFVTGLVFSVCELVKVCTSPIFGTYLAKIGAKYLYIAGLVISSITSALFGLLEYCPGGNLFVFLCFALRTVEAIATAAFETACYAILANTFPNKVATVVGYLELFIGLGLMLGPPVGGILFKVGGFKMPFIVTAMLNLVIAFFSIYLVPNQQCLKKLDTNKTCQMLKLPVVVLMLMAVVTGMSCDAFIVFTLALRLKEVYNFGPGMIGLLYLVGPGLYAISCPLWGYLADEKPGCGIPLMLMGSLMLSVGFLFMGPAPFLPIPIDNLWLLLVCVALAAFGLGPFVNSFQVISSAAVESGLPENLETFGVVSGLYAMATSIGSFIGPLLGGYLLDTVQFEWASFIFGCFAFLYVIATVIYLFFASRCTKTPTEPLDNPGLINETTLLMKKDFED